MELGGTINNSRIRIVEWSLKITRHSRHRNPVSRGGHENISREGIRDVYAHVVDTDLNSSGWRDSSGPGVARVALAPAQPQAQSGIGYGLTNGSWDVSSIAWGGGVVNTTASTFPAGGVFPPDWLK